MSWHVFSVSHTPDVLRFDPSPGPGWNITPASTARIHWRWPKPISSRPSPPSPPPRLSSLARIFYTANNHVDRKCNRFILRFARPVSSNRALRDRNAQSVSVAHTLVSGLDFSCLSLRVRSQWRESSDRRSTRAERIPSTRRSHVEPFVFVSYEQSGNKDGNPGKPTREPYQSPGV